MLLFSQLKNNLGYHGQNVHIENRTVEQQRHDKKQREYLEKELKPRPNSFNPLFI